MMLQELATPFGQRHERRLHTANDVGPRLHQPLLTEPAQFSLSRTRGASPVVQEVLRRDDTEGARRREDSHLGLTKVHRSIAVSNRLSPCSPGQIQIAREHVARVAGPRFMPVLVTAASTAQLGSLALVRAGIDVTPHAATPTPSSRDGGLAGQHLWTPAAGPCATASGRCRGGRAVERCRSTRRTSSERAPGPPTRSPVRDAGRSRLCTAPERTARPPAKRPLGRWSAPPGTRRWRSLLALLERLIDAEIADLKAERIHANELVRHMVAQREIDLRDERLARAFLPGPGRIQQLLKAHRRLVRGLGHFAEAHVLNDDVDLVGGWVREERFEHPALLVLGDRGVSQRRLEAEQGVRIFTLHRRSQPAEM